MIRTKYIPTSYYTSKYTGEEMDALLDKVAAQSQS